MRTVNYEFGPLTWATGRAYVHDADFDEPTDLYLGEVVLLRGEDGTAYRAVVAGVETGELGRTWALRVDSSPALQVRCGPVPTAAQPPHPAR